MEAFIVLYCYSSFIFVFGVAYGLMLRNEKPYDDIGENEDTAIPTAVRLAETFLRDEGL